MKIRNPTKIVDSPKEIGRYKQASLCWNGYKYSLKILERPPMTLEILSPKRTLKSGALKRLSKLDTDENPAQANIQGVVIHIFKK